jgi:hypothetical protein
MRRALILAGFPSVVAVALLATGTGPRGEPQHRGADRGACAATVGPRAVSPLEDTLALGVGHAWDGEPVHGRILERKSEDAQR